MRWWLVSVCMVTVLVVSSCTGPDEFGGAASESTPVPSPTAADEPEPTATAEVAVTPTPDATPEPTPPPSPTPEPEETATPTVEPTPEAEPTPTEPPEPTPTPAPPSAMESLPTAEELSESGYIVADQGDRTAEQLARAYTDTTAHLLRLEEWGFQQHVYREFNRLGANPDDPVPGYVLTTVNVYGSPEQAETALQWLERLQLNLGATAVDAPQLGDAAVALTIPTAQGEQTASVYVLKEERVYIYYAQGNDPLPMVTGIATRVFERLEEHGQVAGLGWSF
jgi:hypothetical protein